MELVALRKQVAELQQRNEALQSRLRVANDEISRLRGKDAATIDSTSGTGTRRDAADVDAAAWVSSQLQLHDREQASQQLLLTICELLQVPEPTDIIPALSTVVRAVKRLPQMDSFIGEVAAIVLEASSRADLRSRSLHDIVPILHRWKAERADGRIEDLRAFRASIAQALMLAQPPVECDHDEVGDAHMKRLARPRDLADNYRLMVSQVVQLVQDRTESQRQLLSRQGVYRQAEALMDPQSLPTQMIRHFQRLFMRTDDLEGVFPTLNQLWLQTNQTTTCLKVLRHLLYLPPDASIQACVAAVEQRLATRSCAEYR